MFKVLALNETHNLIGNLVSLPSHPQSLLIAKIECVGDAEEKESRKMLIRVVCAVSVKSINKSVGLLFIYNSI